MPLTSYRRVKGRYLRREIHVYQRVHGSFMPKLVAWDEHDLEPILILEDLSTCTWPPPWDERRVQLVLIFR